ncbi:MAG: diacylglycerol kinase family lipid kinase [Candidatus Marinimicrobia bacterium]|nr:diacylglycerol kinase family lipid kinase [Candidatus Neomarinimicrobiota bacterium]MCF7828086.1 diacylglycerol kinase family lipid kinase [Candidatus Neomarinimicrobiota bacterium]MCF7879739.1 diacylglycerol kinase family lipid kinase [Candidatus Neomarinimicrobiota bacterium]
MAAAHRYKIIANPAAGHGKTLRHLDEVQHYLIDAGLDYTLEFTHTPLEAADIAHKTTHEDYDVVVAFGGDGTINEVLNGLVGEDCHLGIIPCGTGNDFARSAGIPNDIGAAIEILKGHSVQSIDIGKVGGRFFINSVGVGFDALVNHQATKITRLRGEARYVAALIKSLLQYAAIDMEVKFNGTIKVGRTYLVALGNGHTVGGGFRLTPDAVLNDASFDICYIEDVSIGTILRHFPKLFNGKIGAVQQVTMERSPDLYITSDHNLPVHMDGEVFAMNARDIHVQIVPDAVKVIGNWDRNATIV